MTTQTNKGYEVKIGRTEIIIPYKDKKLTFISPAKGHDTYVNLGKQILNDNLKLPTGEYTASLLHAAYYGPEDFKNTTPISNVRNIMKEGWMYVFNKNLWIPKKQENAGVFVVYDEKGVGLSQDLNQGKLEKALEEGEEIVINGVKIKVSKDRKIRFASRDSYEGGFQSAEDFAKNGFVIANYLEGANQLAEVSKTFDSEPKVWILDSTNSEQRVSALSGDGGWLHVGGGFDGGSRSRAFGVLG